MQLHGLHHVTAVTGNAPANVAFYTQVLGLRLVKKTVNQDDVSAYHLFYGDETGSPGTELTFFDWPHAGPNVHGTGTIAEIGLRVAGRDALRWWADRLAAAGIATGPIEERAGRAALRFRDPEGQRLALVDDGGAPAGTPWRDSPVPPQNAIRGLHSVTIVERTLDRTARLLTDVLGFAQRGSYAVAGVDRPVTIFALADGTPGTELHVQVESDLPYGYAGIGGVHHVAFRAATDAEQQQWQTNLARRGVRITPVIDRFYFKSVYFREPGGVLFEIATDGPGFATDEDVAHLGERLSLPPFLEPQRAAIEAGLRPIEVVKA
jgi:glyoxalase family protein